MGLSYTAATLYLLGSIAPWTCWKVAKPPEAIEKIGLARGQFQWVHQHGMYDLEMDTHKLDADTCAEKIKSALTNPTSPTALEQLKARFDTRLNHETICMGKREHFRATIPLDVPTSSGSYEF